MDEDRLRTLAIHAGEQREDGGLTTPLNRSSTYHLGEPETFDDIRYIRLNNTPTQVAVEAKLAALEGGAALVTPSGTSAIYLAVAALLTPGAKVLAPKRVYGGTRKILDELARREGIEVAYVDLNAPESWAAVAEGATMFYVESLTNPWLEVGALDEVIAFAKERGLTTIVDNTLLSPVFYRPLEAGFDVVVHSASKVLNGHTDVVAGVVAGAPEVVWTIRKYANKLGVCPDPQACWLLLRGLKTLVVRARAQAESAKRFAEALERHPAVSTVRYPGLESSSSYERASRWFRGFGAMVTFDASGVSADVVIKRLRLATEAPSLGGIETLVCRPVTTSHAGLPEETRQAMDVTGAMIRVSVGLEDPDDILADFERALAVPRLATGG